MKRASFFLDKDIFLSFIGVLPPGSLLALTPGDLFALPPGDMLALPPGNPPMERQNAYDKETKKL